jgi:hypothetical protein
MTHKYFQVTSIPEKIQICKASWYICSTAWAVYGSHFLVCTAVPHPSRFNLVFLDFLNLAPPPPFHRSFSCFFRSDQPVGVSAVCLGCSVLLKIEFGAFISYFVCQISVWAEWSVATEIVDAVAVQRFKGNCLRHFTGLWSAEMFLFSPVLVCISGHFVCEKRFFWFAKVPLCENLYLFELSRSWCSHLVYSEPYVVFIKLIVFDLLKVGHFAYWLLIVCFWLITQAMNEVCPTYG